MDQVMFPKTEEERVKERPILFSCEMVKAILEGRKTQTRRIITRMCLTGNGPQDFVDGSCPYGKPGDRLWVRETWAGRTDVDGKTDPEKARHYAMYRADGGDPKDPLEWHDYGGRWISPIHMPRWASRITLEVVDVRVE